MFENVIIVAMSLNNVWLWSHFSTYDCEVTYKIKYVKHLTMHPYYTADAFPCNRSESVTTRQFTCWIGMQSITYTNVQMNAHAMGMDVDFLCKAVCKLDSQLPFCFPADPTSATNPKK